MARIAGIEIPDKNRIDYALTRLKGIGWTKSVELLKSAGVSASTRVKDLTSDDLNKITVELEKYVTEGDLVRQIKENIRRLRDINAYRGVRHSRGLPTRGQRTKSNARTKRGKRKTVGAFKKEMLAKVEAAKKDK